MKRLIDWFSKTKTAVWRGVCVPCGEVYTHRGTEPTKTKCNKRGCKGTIVWQIVEV